MTGVALTTTSTHAPQLSPSLDSVMTPAEAELVLSAQALIEYVPTDGKVIEGEVAVAVPETPSAPIALEVWSVTVPPPLAAVAVWKKLLKPAPVVAEPVLEIVEVYVRATPAVAVAGVGAAAVKFGCAAALTTTVALDGELAPPALEQVRVYVYVFTVVSTPWEIFVPETAFAPDQSPLAVQDVGLFVALQVRLGLTTFTVPEVGFAEIVTTGTATLVTLTFVQAEQLSPSLDSVIAPLIDILLSAQRRTEYVPAEPKV